LQRIACLAANATEGKTMANFSISLTHIVVFLMISGILTWTILAIVGAWHVLTWLEKLCDRAVRRERLVKIYRHG
jgi:hypothetical protein